MSTPQRKQPRKWQPLHGSFEADEEEKTIVFKGGPFVEPTLGVDIGAWGLALCDLHFAGGSISAKLSFASIDPMPVGQLLLFQDPESGLRVTAGFGIRPAHLCLSATA